MTLPPRPTVRAFLVLFAFLAAGCAAMGGAGAAPPPGPPEPPRGKTVLVASRSGEALVVRALAAASVAAGYDFGERVPVARFVEGAGRVIVGLFRPDGSGGAVLGGQIGSRSRGARVEGSAEPLER